MKILLYLAMIGVLITSLCQAENNDDDDDDDDDDNLQVKLHLLSPAVSPNAIKEYSTVKLLCAFSTKNPTNNIRKIRWFLDNTELLHDTTRGIIIPKNAPLKISAVDSSFSGKYMCKIETDTEILPSNILKISIKPKSKAKEVREWLMKTGNLKKTHDIESPFRAGLMAYSRLGDDIRSDDIRDDDDVYLTCSFENNVTKIEKITWIYDNRETVVDNPAKGIKLDGPNLILNDIDDDTDGKYHCIVTAGKQVQAQSEITEVKIKKVGNATNTTSTKKKDDSILLIQLGPESDPDTIIESTDVYLTCNLFPKDKLRIRRLIWYHNGKRMDRNETVGLIDGNSTLILPSIKRYYAGSYQCEADCGESLFKSRSLVINVLSAAEKFFPTVTARIGRKWSIYKIKLYDNVPIHCDIKPNMTNVRQIQWLRDGKNVSRHTSKMTWPTDIDFVRWDPVLIIPKVKRRDSGKYQCVVTNKGGISVKSNEVNLDVGVVSHKMVYNTRAVIIAELLNNPETIYVGSELTFRCHNHLYMNASYEDINWFHNGEKLLRTIDTRVYYYSNDTISFSHARKENIGNYTCRVVTDYDFYTSNIVQLTKILDKPETHGASQNLTEQITVTAELQNDPYDIYELDNVYLYCNVQPNTTNFKSLTWFLNGGAMGVRFGDFIPFGQRTLQRLGRISNEERFERYECEIATYDGTRYRSDPTEIQIHLEERPHNTVSPHNGKPELFVQLVSHSKSSVVFENKDIYFTCGFKSNATRIFEINWFQDGNPIYSYARSGIIQMDSNLYMYNVTIKASGNYSCRAETKRGPIDSNKIRLDVISV